jgi:predicted amidophosphoribosyltransferase
LDNNGYTCDVCGDEVFHYPIERLCPSCEEKLQRNNSNTCEKCGRKTFTEGVCLTCKASLPAFTRGFSPFVYIAHTAGYINRIKNGNRRLSCFFGEEMTKTLLRSYPKMSEFEAPRYATNVENPLQTPQNSLLIVPVPTTQNTRRKRGYNQAQDLAEQVAESLQKAGYVVELDVDVLQKRKETAQQKHMHYQERIENVAGAYHVHKRSVCKGRTVVLVDDIMTTGATGDACAKRLLGAGAKEVLFLVAAALAEPKQS